VTLDTILFCLSAKINPNRIQDCDFVRPKWHRMIVESESTVGRLADHLRPMVYLHVKDLVDEIGSVSSPAYVRQIIQDLREIVRGLHLIQELEETVLLDLYPNLEEWALALVPQPDQYLIADLARPPTLTSWIVAYEESGLEIHNN